MEELRIGGVYAIPGAAGVYALVLAVDEETGWVVVCHVNRRGTEIGRSAFVPRENLGKFEMTGQATTNMRDAVDLEWLRAVHGLTPTALLVSKLLAKWDPLFLEGGSLTTRINHGLANADVEFVWQATTTKKDNQFYYVGCRRLPNFGNACFDLMRQLLEENGTPIGMALPPGDYPWNKPAEK